MPVVTKKKPPTSPAEKFEQRGKFLADTDILKVDGGFTFTGSLCAQT